MATRRLEFEFYPHSLAITAGSVIITDLSQREAIVADVLAWGGVYNDWVYAPPHLEIGFGDRRGKRELPYPSRIFGLAKTHSIEHRDCVSEDQLTFHLWSLSFFKGMRFTATPKGFLDATPLKPGRLVDFHVSDRTLALLVERADAFWNANTSQPSRAQRFAAAVHALFVAQGPRNLQFERFIYLYTALDACYALTSDIRRLKKKPGHGEQIRIMCDELSIETPAWAKKGVDSGAEIVAIRNETIHEALFMGQPLGFAAHQDGRNPNLTSEMQALVCRILIALIAGQDLEYVSSPTDTLQYHLLHLS